MAELAFFTGGARSGKSSFAEAYSLRLANERRLGPVAYFATGQPMDAEFERRIAHHKSSRDARFLTVEEGLDLVAGFARARELSPVVLLECISTWLGNVFHHKEEAEREPYAMAQVEGLLAALAESPGVSLNLVTNELGMGVVPIDAYTRHYCDVHGRVNRRLAEAASKAWLIVSGLPVVLKE